MAYDGIVTMAVAHELSDSITMGKIDKVYQPESDELVLNIHTKNGNRKLFASVNPAASRLHLTCENIQNPPAPFSFCMLMRKHIQNGRITGVHQKDSERIIEIDIETLNELGFAVSKRLIFEIMGKHSNIVLTDISTGKIIDAIKHISIDVNRVRQILPGLVYQYPPVQDKIPFKKVTENTSIPADPKGIQRTIGGISPAFAEELSHEDDPHLRLRNVISAVSQGSISPVVYSDEKNSPKEFYLTPLAEYEDVCQVTRFDDMESCLEYFYSNKKSTNKLNQKASSLIRSVTSQIDKLHLKEQRLKEDLLKAENSEELRLYGELLTASIHQIEPGAKNATVLNYYDGSEITIPLDPRFSPSKNAQNYFKKYGKAKTAVKEKQIQLDSVGSELAYLGSVLSYLENAEEIDDIDALRKELEEGGYVRRRKIPGGFKEKKYQAKPYKYELPGGAQVLVGRNNKENDFLTFKLSSSKDIWLHTKDIPGSHVILRGLDKAAHEPDEKTIYAAASIAAYYSKARGSENVPVDYVPIKYVKKPQGAKPGMVIFTNNRTVWVNPKLPQ